VDLIERTEGYYALVRYFAWVHAMSEEAERHNRISAAAPPSESSGPLFEMESIKAGAFIGYWYAGLQVVVEGWRELGLREPAIDQMLDSPHATVLRRFRNGMFHFQRSLDDARFTDLMHEASDAHVWTVRLSMAFRRFFTTLEQRPDLLRAWLEAEPERPGAEGCHASRSGQSNTRRSS
jgi:hypothetical protein